MIIPTYLSFDGVDLHFDAVTDEQATHTADVTEHPVEEGANVSDHVQDQLDTVTLEVFVTNQPIKDVNNVYGLDENYTEMLDVDGVELVQAGKKLDVPKSRPFPVTPGALMQTVGNFISDMLADDTVAQVYGQTKPKTTSYPAQVLNWPTKFNAITDVVGILVDWKKRGVVGQVITPWKTFPSVVITSVSTTKDASVGDAAKVLLTFKEIRIVESKLVTAPVPTEPRAKTRKAKGRQPVTIEYGDKDDKSNRKKSLLKKLTS